MYLVVWSFGDNFDPVLIHIKYCCNLIARDAINEAKLHPTNFLVTFNKDYSIVTVIPLSDIMKCEIAELIR